MSSPARTTKLLLAALCAAIGCADDSAVGGAGGSGHAGGGAAGVGGGAGGVDGLGGAGGAVMPKELTTFVSAEDGTQLFTWVVLPDEIPAEGVPALLARTPYGSPYSAEVEEFYRDMGRVHAARGYAYVLQDVRGRGQSQGEFIPETFEIVDGRTTTEWMAAQPWSNGRIGTIGGSYLGYTALAAAIDNPLVQVVIADDPSNDERTTRPGGTVWTYTLGWIYYLENGAFPPDAAYAALPDELDLLAADTVFLGHDLGYWNGIVEHDDIGPWPAGSLDLVAQDACVPALFVYSSTTLWRDPLTAYRAFRELGCPQMKNHQRLVMTHDPHTYHLSLLGFDDTQVTTLMLATIDNYLRGNGALLDVPLVLYNPPGELAYLESTAYPAEATVELYLAAGALTAAPGAAETVSLTSDPATMSPCALDYPYLELVSAPLETAIDIVGEPMLDLVASTSLGDFDVFATLYELNGTLPDGGRFVQIGSQRATYRASDVPVALPTAGTPFDLPVSLLPVAHRVEAGSQLVLYLSTADCAAFENPQSGEPPESQTVQVAGDVSFHFGGAAPLAAHLTLPVTP